MHDPRSTADMFDKSCVDLHIQYNLSAASVEQVCTCLLCVHNDAGRSSIYFEMVEYCTYSHISRHDTNEAARRALQG